MLIVARPETVLNVLKAIDRGSSALEKRHRRLEKYAQVVELKRITTRGKQKLLEMMSSNETFGRVWPLLLVAAVKSTDLSLDRIAPEPLQLGRKFGLHITKRENPPAFLARPAVSQEEGLYEERAVTAGGASVLLCSPRDGTLDIGVEGRRIIGDFPILKLLVKATGAVASGKRTDVTLIAVTPEMTPRARRFFFTHHPKGTLILWQGERFSVHRLHDARSEKIDEYREDGSVIGQSHSRFPEMSGVLEVHAISETDWNPETHRSIVGPTEKAMERLRELRAGRQAITLKVVRDAAIYAVGFLKPDHEDAARILSICRKFSSQIRLSAEIINAIREELDRAVKEIEHRFDPPGEPPTATRPPPEPSPPAPPRGPEPETEPRTAGPVGPRREGMAGGDIDLAEAVSLDHATFLKEGCRPLLGERYGILATRLAAYHAKHGNVARLLGNLVLIHQKGGPETVRMILEDLVSPSSDPWDDSLLKGIGRFGEMAGTHPIAAPLWPSVRDDAFTPRHGKALALVHREVHGAPAETLDIVRRLAQAWRADWLTTLDRLALILRKPDDPLAEPPRNLRSWFRGMLEGKISDSYIAAVFNQFALYHRVGLALADSYFTVNPGKAVRRVVAEGPHFVTRSVESPSKEGPCNLPLLADGRAVLYASADKANLGLTVSRVDLVDAMALTSQTGQKAVWVVETLKEILPGALRLFWQLHPEGEVIRVRGDQVARLRHEGGDMVTTLGGAETRAPFSTRPKMGDIVLEGLTPELDPEWNPEEADWPALFAKAGIGPERLWGPLRELFSLPDLGGPLTPDNLTTWLGDIRTSLEAHLTHLSVAHDLFPNAPELFPTEKSTEWKDRADALEIRALEAYTSSANEAEGTAKILGLATVAEEIREIVREILETELTGYRQLLNRVAPRLARDDRPESLGKIMDQLPVMIGQVSNYDIDLGPDFSSDVRQVRCLLASLAYLLNQHASLQAPSGSYRYQSRADLELPPTKPTFEDLAAFLKQHSFVEERDIGGQAVLFREPRSGVTQKIERRLEHFENVRKNNRMYAIRAVEAALRKQGLMAPDVASAATPPAPSAARNEAPPREETDAPAEARRPVDDEGASEDDLSRRAEVDLRVLRDLLDRASKEATARKALEGMRDLRHHLVRLEDPETRAAIEALVPYNNLARRAKRRREASVPRLETPARAVTPVPAVVPAPAAAIANGVAEPEPAAPPPPNSLRTVRQIIESLLNQRTIESHDPQSKNYYLALNLLSSLSDGQLSDLADELILHLMGLAGKFVGRKRPKQVVLAGILKRIFVAMSDGSRADYRERIAGHRFSRVKLDADGAGERPILEALFPPPTESETLRRARNLINGLTSFLEIQRFIRSTGHEKAAFYAPLEEALGALQAEELDILAEALIPDLIETTTKKAASGKDRASSMYINICRRVFLCMGGPQKAKYRERLQASEIGAILINIRGFQVPLMSNLF